jgi:hypothetical protein
MAAGAREGGRGASAAGPEDGHDRYSQLPREHSLLQDRDLAKVGVLRKQNSLAAPSSTTS